MKLTLTILDDEDQIAFTVEADSNSPDDFNHALQKARFELYTLCEERGISNPELHKYL